MLEVIASTDNKAISFTENINGFAETKICRGAGETEPR